MADGGGHGRGRQDALAILPEGTAPPASVPPGVFAAAVDVYLAGQRLEMQALARRAGVGRATLYRRAGNREQLLDAVIWWRARRLLARQAEATASLTGAERIAAMIGRVLRAVERDRPLHALIGWDPEAALRILTGSRSAVQRGMSGALQNLIDLERERGAFRTDLDTPTLAYAIVRISEGFLYADVIADRPPDVGRAITVIEALLAGLDVSAYGERLHPSARRGHGHRPDRHAGRPQEERGAPVVPGRARPSGQRPD